MSRSLRTLATLALVAFAGLLLVAAWIAGRLGSAPGMAQAEALDALGQRLGRIESRLARLEAAPTESPRNMGVPAPAGSGHSPAAGSRRSAAESEAAARKLRAGLDTRFASSPTGRRDAQASRQLLDAMEDEALLAATSPPVARDILCRQGLCRMEFLFTEPGVADDWMTFYPPLTGRHVTRTQYFVERGPDGLTRVVAYGHRR